LGTITILIVQTEWMKLQIMQDVVQYEPFQEFVTDAAHKFWQIENWVLIETLVYSRHFGQ
jgi:hypothetical protein